ncbi:MAG: cytochrome c biogenesis protein ResB [Candidatus Omnitrophica bacterium]|nr:cytochrome c biogenesis protein ResB [Candidatus Omnitrophota bacterium]
MNFIIKKLGSVGFTVVISAGLIVLLIVSTSMEAVYGTPFAQKVFYQTRWFDFLMVLLWVNILCSTLVRFPYKKEYLGFVITHIGILGILIGAMISKYYGIDGNMVIFEGETASRMEQSGHLLSVNYPNQEQESFLLSQKNSYLVLNRERRNSTELYCPLKPKKNIGVEQEGERVPFCITNIFEHAMEKKLVTEGNPNGEVNRAVSVKLFSQQLDVDESIWLFEHEPGNPASAAGSEQMVGPVKLNLRPDKKIEPAQRPTLRILDKSGQELLAIDPEKVVPAVLPLQNTGYSVKNFVYYPFAAVAGHNKIVNLPNGRMFNPAVEFDLVDSQGNVFHQLKFGFFPEFEAMHDKADKRVSSSLTDIQVKFAAGKPEDYPDVYSGGQIVFYFDNSGAWRYQVKFQGKVTAQGNLILGRTFSTGYMNLEFSAEKIISHARVNYNIAPSSDPDAPMAVAVTVERAGTKDLYWVIENQLTPVAVDQGTVNFFLSHEMRELPFSIVLKQFRKINYPGTQDAASFESDVVLHDSTQGVTLERTISMNQPLNYAGFKIFQSSYFDDPKNGKASVFTVAKNPGIPWIYLSSLIACIGALIHFNERKVS